MSNQESLATLDTQRYRTKINKTKQNTTQKTVPYQTVGVNTGDGEG